MRFGIIWHRFGPYHMARLRALARRVDLTAIEMSGEDRTYNWSKVSGSDGFRRVTVFPECDCDTQPRGEVQARLWKVLDEVRPEVLAIPSWGESYALSALAWSLKSRTPNFVMSCSNRYDSPRKCSTEAVKRQIVRCFQAGLVSSQHQRGYLASLGVPIERIYCGYNTIDNAYFASGAAQAIEKAAALREAYKLPEAYFLASARFVQKKNLPRFLDAFGQYRAAAGGKAWHLVLLGDGALRTQLEERCRTLNLDGWVHMPGFAQYDTLPAYYGLARAFVLPSIEEQWGNVINESMACGLPVLVSKRCGCAETLVHDGVNGFVFDPLDVGDMTRLLLKCSSGELNLAAMGQAGREIISQWTPERFAENSVKAAECARALPRLKAGLLSRIILSMVLRAR